MAVRAAESVLVNFVNWEQVGHAVEAVHCCLGYHRADPSRRIGIVLNANTATDIAHWCPFIDEVYTVDVTSNPGPAALAHIPRDWDWVVDDGRNWSSHREAYPELTRYYDYARDHFRTTAGHVAHDLFQIGKDHSEPATGAPSYRTGNRLSLELPAAARSWAESVLPGTGGAPTIAVLPAGSDLRWRYPSTDSWRLILKSLQTRFPSARFCFVGKLAADERTSTAFSRREFDALAAVVTEAVSAVDRPLAEQLAAIERCDLLLSPHSGYSFAGLAVGTPWLVLSGNKWYEHYFNPGVPFYSVLPDLARYPCYVWLGNEPDPVDDDGPRSPSMCAERIRADLPELLDAAGRLIEGTWDFPAAMADHFARLSRISGGRTDVVFTFDDLHTAYLPH
ncbi:glycosyltransferase family 9 protein [Amycolatopsis sp. NPDC059027]|uniref:glycosyltransferase family 9 protein n=1 Tax=unclassified Amycolatopsis TaxID=2618356 RepID=UPI00366CFD6E